MKFGWAKLSARRIFFALILTVLAQPDRSRAQRSPAMSPPKGNGTQSTAVTARDSQTSRENGDSLSLADSDLHADTPVLGGKAEYAGFTRELLQVKWREGDAIDLYVIRPTGVAKPPVVLYLYGYPSETDRFRNEGYCKRVTQDGFAAVGFVSALTGHRYHTRPMREWFVSELQESVVTSVHDVQMIINYLASRGEFDMNQVGMFGEGSGGTIAILSAAVDPRIKAIDVLDPWADWPDWMAKSALIPGAERPNYVKPEFLKKIAFFDPLLWLPKLKSQAIRIQDIKDDDVTPAICQQRLESAAPPSAELAKFDSDQAHFQAMSGGRVFDWIKDQLRPATEPKAGN
jgi:hypothetical protein